MVVQTDTSQSKRGADTRLFTLARPCRCCVSSAGARSLRASPATRGAAAATDTVTADLRAIDVISSMVNGSQCINNTTFAVSLCLVSILFSHIHSSPFNLFQAQDRRISKCSCALLVGFLVHFGYQFGEIGCEHDQFFDRV